MLTKKSRFFGARSPSKLVYIGAKGAFRKILGSVGQKWISEKVSKGGPFGSAGGRIPEGGGGERPPPPPPPPPKSAPDIYIYSYIFGIHIQFVNLFKHPKILMEHLCSALKANLQVTSRHQSSCK